MTVPPDPRHCATAESDKIFLGSGSLPVVGVSFCPGLLEFDKGIFVVNRTASSLTLVNHGYILIYSLKTHM